MKEYTSKKVSDESDHWIYHIERGTLITFSDDIAQGNIPHALRRSSSLVTGAEIFRDLKYGAKHAVFLMLLLNDLTIGYLTVISSKYEPDQALVKEFTRKRDEYIYFIWDTRIDIGTCDRHLICFNDY